MNRVSAPVRRPLVVASRPELLDELLSVASAAGAEVDVAVDREHAGALWRTAPVVVVADHPEVHRDAGERRSGVLLVSSDLDDADVWRRAHLLGADHVVLLPDGRSWLVDRLADAVEDGGSGSTVVVVGARGGAGASVLSAAVAARCAAAGLSSVLVDGDAAGGGIDLALGAEDLEGIRWPELALVEGRIPGAALIDALPERHSLRFLSCTREQEQPITMASLDAVLSAVARVSDVVVVDAPRHDEPLLRCALDHADLVLLVVPAEVRAVASATRLMSAVMPDGARVQVVVRLPGGGELSADAVSDAVDAPRMGTVKDDARAAAAIDRGDGPPLGRRAPWHDVCEAVLALVSEQIPAAS